MIPPPPAIRWTRAIGFLSLPIVPAGLPRGSSEQSRVLPPSPPSMERDLEVGAVVAAHLIGLRSRRSREAAAVLVCASLLGIGIVEFGVRSLSHQFVPYQFPAGYHVADPDAGYRLARDFPRTLVDSRAGTRDLCVTNSLGLRDVEIPPGQDPRRIVVVLGASLVYGWGASELEETWPRVLDREIRTKFPRHGGYHFVNAGVSGYNHFQAIALYEKLLDEIEIGYAILAHPDPLVQRDVWGHRGMYTVFHDNLMLTDLKSTLRRLPSRILGVTAFDPIHERLMNAMDSYFLLSSLLAKRYLLPEKLEYSSGPEAVSKAFAEFRAVSLKHGVTPLIAYLPMANTFGRKSVRTESIGRRVAATLGIPFLDPKQEMLPAGTTAATAASLLTHVHDPHYSPRGNAIYAEALAPLVVEYLK